MKIKHNWHVTNNQMSKPISEQVSATWITDSSISSDSDGNIDEKDIVQSDPEIDKDSDEEPLMI